jgi:hypothetical protein
MTQMLGTLAEFARPMIREQTLTGLPSRAYDGTAPWTSPKPHRSQRQDHQQGSGRPVFGRVGRQPSPRVPIALKRVLRVHRERQMSASTRRRICLAG